MKRAWKNVILGAAVTLVGLVGIVTTPAPAAAVSMADYTSYPIFVSQTVSPDILFIVDFSDAMLPAAYGNYALSYPSSGGIGATYASNYKGSGLTITTTPAGSATPTALADTFNSSVAYFGMFDSLGCYSYASGQFGSRTAKTLVTDACGSSQWDGNFLNWLAIRKIDQAKKVLIGGRTLSASNNDGTANTLLGEPKTGQYGSTNTCNSTSKPCYRYVKFVPNRALTGRVPTSLPSDTAWSTTGSEAPGTISSSGTSVTGVGTMFTQQFQVGDSIIAGGQTSTVQSIASDTALTISSAFPTNLNAGTAYYAPGRYFGQGEATIYVNDNSTAVPFDDASSSQFAVQLDLTSESTAYRQQMSLGLLQTMRTDDMRVAVMFTNSSNGVAATVFRYFDGTLNASAITGIRNQALAAYAALAEGTYEAFCYYRNSQGACFSNSPADFTASVGQQGDPYFFVSLNQMVWCCKSFILMISAGVPSNDQNNTPSPAPFGNLMTSGSDTIGLSSTRLDDVAYYGNMNDIRNQASGTTGYLQGTQNVVFYSVNAMGGAAGAAVLASAAMYGGFTDQNGNGMPDLTGQTCTYPAGSSLGSGSSTSSQEWDVNQDCIPDTYFSAADGGSLLSQINQAIAAILKQAASGTSASVLASSSSGVGTVYQAFFLPAQFQAQNEIIWTGYTQGLFLDAFGNLREDTDGDGRLVYQNDNIIRTRFDSSTNSVKVDEYQDTDGDGMADSTTPFETVGLTQVKPIWEAGRRLALTSPSSRNILTWVDGNNNGVVDSGEFISFNTANVGTLAPYLAISLSAGSIPSTITETDIINFALGTQVTGLRNRQLMVTDDSGNTALQVWKYGDPVDSTPTIVGAPKERYDIIYGDATYATFYQQYLNRRQVLYVGANDGMLHAFNAGFYHRGDDPSTSSVTEHGWFTRTPTDNSSGALLGQELWGFVPYNLLPHLQWLANPNYTHVYYVDLKPKVTDVRIFTPDADHPNGWGTILIGGFRYGGSCGPCVSTTGGTPMTVTANFGTGTQTRTFYSAYFVLDITNPEKNPVLLWSFSSSSLGLTTSYPAVLRVNPFTNSNTDSTNEKWFMVVGSGVTGYSGNSAQTGTVFAVDLKAGPSSVVTFPTSDSNSFMGDVITLDANLDFRTDVVYLGNVISNGSNTPSWYGKLYRLTTASAAPFGGNTTASSWGYNAGSGGVPTVLLATFPSGGSTLVGPVTAAPTVTADDASKMWVFFGTGRFYSAADKANTDTQYFFGVKDPVAIGACTQSSVTSCQKSNLLNVSNVTICVVCTGGTNQVTGVTGVTTFSGTATTTLEGLVQSMDGWYTTLPTSGERVLSAPTVLGGTVFFTTFIPTTDICSAAGNGNVYALYYKTGSAYKQSVIGTYTSGSNTNVLRSMSLGTGLPSQMAVQIGAQGSGASGSSSGSGCAGRVTGFIQGSTGVLNQFCGKPALSSWSRYVSWVNQRD